MPRALGCATCPGALNNGLFTPWQHANRGTVPQYPLPACFLPGSPAGPRQAGHCRVTHGPLRPNLYTPRPDSRLRSSQEPVDVPIPPPAALDADCRFGSHRPWRPCRSHPVLRRLRAAAGCADPARRGDAGTAVCLCQRRQPDGAVRRDTPVSGADRGGARSHQAGLHRDRGQPLLRTPRRGLPRRRARDLAAGHHRRPARAGRLHHHPAGGAAVLPELGIQLYAQARRDVAGDQDGARAQQGRDLPAVSQQELLRQPRLRHRRRGRVLLRQDPGCADAGRGGNAGLDPEVPVQRQPGHQSGARAHPP